MAAITASTPMALKASSTKVAGRKAFSGSAVAVKAAPVRASAKFTVRASADNKAEKLQAAVITTAGAMMASPLAAQAADYAVTPSLKNLINSVIAGAVVLGGLVTAVAGVAQFDRVTRK